MPLPQRVGTKAPPSPLLTTHHLPPAWDEVAHVSRLQACQGPQKNADDQTEASRQAPGPAGQPVPTLSLKRAAALLLYFSCRDQHGS